jgi:hypothetical protein
VPSSVIVWDIADSNEAAVRWAKSYAGKWVTA